MTIFNHHSDNNRDIHRVLRACLPNKTIEHKAMITPLTGADVLAAQQRIAGYVHRTPLVTSELLNDWLGSDIVFKVEAMQKVGAFKYRGVTNALRFLRETDSLPTKVIAFSSGNHAQATAKVCQSLGIASSIYMAASSSPLKQAATRCYGADVVLFPSRRLAEEAAYCDTQDTDTYLLHPYDNDMVIAGQGTSCLEALQDGVTPDAIFATCSGGGWISGTYLATQTQSTPIPVYAGEPLQANDAARSYRTGQIVHYRDTPTTIADGATALCIKPRTFQYLKKLAGFYEISEEDILYWTQWLTTLLKITVEPTSAVAMAAAYCWLKEQPCNQQVLVMLSGGNIAPETHKEIWKKSFMDDIPALASI